MNYKQMRTAMVNSQLRTCDVNTPWILDAMSKLPREEFVGEAQREFAYMDRPLKVSGDRMMAPPIVAGQILTRIAPSGGEKILIIGGGSGYVAALIAPQIFNLHFIEPDADLLARAKDNLSGFDNITFVDGDWTTGPHDKNADFGEYDVILLDAVAQKAPEALAALLKDGGKFICGNDDGATTSLCVGIKAGGQVKLVPKDPAYMPFIDALSEPAGFTF
ncbi:hypothetical protein LPB140_01495 [Sphingorhabdus lutea]|uniref:Protein-L-isoaspartate O-methyltransferase n=2 Tax=Sphingorhabdus lutea TaxID=1913578 RepID=A0A1L3J9D3_9SPHN|nr:hypothetical protein LPB140_01495 [Sphingorhabdus lutea]